MQYLLTKDEYEALRKDSAQRAEDESKRLRALCRLALRYVPSLTSAGHERVTFKGAIPTVGDIDVTHGPHGCIYVKDGPDPIHCDFCPVQHMCPDVKDWSQ